LSGGKQLPDNFVLENIVSGNGQQGVMINGSTGNSIVGDYVGTSGNGVNALPNALQGVLMTGTGNTVYGDVIAGNTGAGLDLEAGDNTVQGCDIGLNTDASPLSNGNGGIYIDSAGNVIGGLFNGSSDSYGNVVSGNTTGNGYGILLDTAAATGNVLEGNVVGTNPGGQNPVPNGTGIVVQNGASGNYLGNASSGYGNLVSGNTGYGVELESAGSQNTVVGNYIGTNSAGTAALANSTGISVEEGSSSKNTLILNNVVSGNTNDGIIISGDYLTTTATVQGNLIGTDYTGQLAIGNGMGIGNANGVGIAVEGDGTLVGGLNPGQGNTIAFNSGGIYVDIGGNGAGDVTAPVIEGCTIYHNNGFGIEAAGGGSNVMLSVINCTIVGNYGSGGGQGILNEESGYTFVTLQPSAAPIPSKEDLFGAC
jgi:hypothetical protein